MMPAPGLRLDAPVPVPDHVVVQHVGELVHGDAREAALVEELLLDPAEEPLRGGVVRTASLRARRTRQVVVLADADPFGPPVVAATVGMDDWFLAVLERGARVRQHAVGQRRVQARADRTGDRHAVMADDHGRQVGLARGDRELREVRDPRHVWPFGVEIPVHQVLRRLVGLAFVRVYELYRFALLNRGARPFLVMSLMIRFALATIPMPFNSRWIRLYPYLRLLFSNASRTSSSRPESLSGRFMASGW